MAALSDIPVAALALCLAGLVFVGRYGQLRWRAFVAYPAGERATRRLEQAAALLRRLADAGALPPSGAVFHKHAKAAAVESDAVVYRPCPSLQFDTKLIVLHDAECEHKILEFPSLRDGRGVVFAGGRLRVVTEEVFEKLLAADDALRERLRLPPADRPACTVARDGAE